MGVSGKKSAGIYWIANLSFDDAVNECDRMCVNVREAGKVGEREKQTFR